MSELARRLKAVDPDLKIIPGGGGRRNHTPSSNSEWDKAAGVICRDCGREVFRSRDGLCMACWEQVHEIEIRDRTGITNWLPMTIIEQITHSARKE